MSGDASIFGRAARQILLMGFIAAFVSFLIVGFLFALADCMTAFDYKVNSDWLYIHELADAIYQHGTLRGQDLPVAPYFFPDLLLFSIFRLFSDNPAVNNALHFIFFCATLITFVYLLFRSCGLSRLHSFLSACLAALTFTLLPPYNAEAGENFSLFLKNYAASHTTAANISLAALACYLRVRNGYIGWTSTVLAASIALLSYVSDLILFQYLVCPIAAIAIMDWGQGRLPFRSAALILLATLVPLAISISARPILYNWLEFTSTIPFSFRPTVSQEALETGLKNFFGAMRLATSRSPFFYSQILFLTAIGLVAVTYSILPTWKGQVRGAQFNNLRSIAIFFALAQVATLGSGVALNLLSHPTQFRYLIPSYLFPVVLVYLLLARQLYSSSKLTRHLAACAMIAIPAINLVLLVATSNERLRTVRFAAPYPEWIRCIDSIAKEYDLTAGLATYWDTRPVRMLSRSSLLIGQIDDNLELDFLTGNYRSIFRPDGTLLNFQFVVARIAGTITPEKIKEKVGEPDALVKCPAWQNTALSEPEPGPTLLIYKSKAAHSSLNSFANQSAASYQSKKERIYTVGSTLDFGIRGNAAIYLQQGWPSQESTGSWTVGKIASLLMTPEGAEASDNLKLVVRAKTFSLPARPMQTVTVEVNGNVIDHWVVTSGDTEGEHSAIIPAALRHPNGPMSITFKLGDVRSPSELTGTPGDNRKLGLFVTSLRLEPQGLAGAPAE